MQATKAALAAAGGPIKIAAVCGGAWLRELAWGPAASFAATILPSGQAQPLLRAVCALQLGNKVRRAKSAPKLKSVVAKHPGVFKYDAAEDTVALA